MNSWKHWIRSAIGSMALTSLCAADNHKWEIVEIFSSADGSVQFIELFNADKDEHNLSLTSISTASGSFFAFPSNLPSTQTQNRRVLIATAAFAAIPGAPAPDYVIPAGFLRRSGDTITYAATPHAVSFGALPVDGLMSINAAGVTGTNSPTNFAGLTGSLVLATAVVRNGSNRNPLCFSASPPALGKVWMVTVDATNHSGAQGAIIAGYALPSTGPRIPAGQLLIDLFSQQLFLISLPVSGGLVQLSKSVPVNLGLIGRKFSTQALIFGGQDRLCNAVDLKFGW